jgi:hypothetical protein
MTRTPSSRSSSNAGSRPSFRRKPTVRDRKAASRGTLSDWSRWQRGRHLARAAW